MRTILYLVPEQEEQSFSSFLDQGIDRLKRKREFCGLSWRGFMEYMFDDEVRITLAENAIYLLTTIPFSFAHSEQENFTLECFNEHFNELLEDYVYKNHQAVLKGYREMIDDRLAEEQITNYELKQISNF